MQFIVKSQEEREREHGIQGGWLTCGEEGRRRGEEYEKRSNSRVNEKFGKGKVGVS